MSDLRRSLLSESLAAILVLLAVSTAYDYERPIVRFLIALPFWAAIRVSWWIQWRGHSDGACCQGESE